MKKKTRLKVKTGFGLRLKEIREQKGLTQNMLASSLGVFPQTVSKLESEASSPNWSTVLAICEALGVTPDAFLPEKQ